jgi:flagellar motor switch protein FliN/FliY
MSDMKLDEFQPTPDSSGPADGLERSAADLAAVYDVPVNIQAVLGEVVVVDERLGVTMTEIIKDGDS